MQAIVLAGAVGFALGALLGFRIGRKAGYKRAIHEGATEAARRYVEILTSAEDGDTIAELEERMQGSH